MRDLSQWKDKVELRLDGRQLFFVFFGGATLACLLFTLGVMTGRRLEARAIGLGTIGRDADIGQRVDEPEGKRDFRADDDELHFLALREFDQAGDIVGGDREARGVGRDAGIARGAEEARLGRRERERLDEGVFAPAGTDDEDGPRQRRGVEG